MKNMTKFRTWSDDDEAKHKEEYNCLVCKNKCKFCNTWSQCSSCEDWEKDKRKGVPHKETKTKFTKQYWESMEAKYPNAFDY
tara:strand:+ start:158 stop:403 length:246 start_codon:yes stop_codon:yes gene_type:complete